MLKNFKEELSPTYVCPLVDAYNKFFGVLHGDQLSRCKKALKNSRLCRNNNDLQIWENHKYDDDNDFVFLNYRKNCFLELMGHIDGQEVVDYSNEPDNVYDHKVSLIQT